MHMAFVIDGFCIFCHVRLTIRFIRPYILLFGTQQARASRCMLVMSLFVAIYDIAALCIFEHRGSRRSSRHGRQSRSISTALLEKARAMCARRCNKYNIDIEHTRTIIIIVHTSTSLSILLALSCPFHPSVLNIPECCACCPCPFSLALNSLRRPRNTRL